MKTALIKFGIYVFSISGFVVLTFVGSMVIYEFVVPDECEYHKIGYKNVSWLFRLFYMDGKESVHHPEPMFFNLIFCVVVGILIGFFVSRFFINIIFKKRNNDVSGVLDKFE